MRAVARHAGNPYCRAIRPVEALGLADMSLAQARLADQRHAETLGDDPPRRPGARQIARHDRVETMGAQLFGQRFRLCETGGIERRVGMAL